MTFYPVHILRPSFSVLAVCLHISNTSSQKYPSTFLHKVRESNKCTATLFRYYNFSATVYICSQCIVCCIGFLFLSIDFSAKFHWGAPHIHWMVSSTWETTTSHLTIWAFHFQVLKTEITHVSIKQQ